MTVSPQRSGSYSPREVEEIARHVAGATSAIFLRMHPKDVMPSEAIVAAIESVLRQHGVYQ